MEVPGPASEGGGQSLTVRSAVVGAVKVYIAAQHVGIPSWHLTLNNHTSTRPKQHGGATIRSLFDVKTFRPPAPGSASPSWQCVLCLPHSFLPNDCSEVRAFGEGPTRQKASEDACRTAFAMLLVADASRVVLRPKHWHVSLPDLVAEVNRLSRSVVEHQPLPVHERPSLREQGVLGDTLAPVDRDEEVAEVLRCCLHAYDGAFDPSGVKHSALGLPPGSERAWMRLNSLLHPGDLRPFVDRHPEFRWEPHGQKGMRVLWAAGRGAPGYVTAAADSSVWAAGGPPASPSPGSASGQASAAPPVPAAPAPVRPPPVEPAAPQRDPVPAAPPTRPPAPARHLPAVPAAPQRDPAAWLAQGSATGQASAAPPVDSCAGRWARHRLRPPTPLSATAGVSWEPPSAPPPRAASGDAV
jgi:hypothetical protein